MPHHEVDKLIAETRWLSGLARKLVHADADAQDLVQDTLTAALRNPPPATAPLRAWLHRVLGNRHVDVRRARASGQARERAMARPERQPATDEVVAKAESQQLLVTAVLALDEPYRATILLRFFERLPPRAIARRMTVPVTTVHSRLQRALAQLRARLDRSHGRDRWLLAVSPLVRPGPFTPWIVGVPLMHALTKLAIAAVIAATALVSWPGGEPAALAPTPVVTVPTPTPMLEHIRPDTAAGAHDRLVADATPAAGQEPPIAATPPARQLRGRVIDVLGIGIAGVPLALEPVAPSPSRATVSGENGRFELEVEGNATAVVAADPRWATVLAGAAATGAERECIVMVAERRQFRGRVVDQAGAPLPGAEVVVHVPAHLGADLAQLLDFALVRTFRATAAADGAFALPDVPSVPRARLVAHLGGFLPHVLPLPAADDLDLTLVLERPASTADVITGIVLDPFGATVAGARVSAGGAIARSDDGGAFTLEVKDGTLPRLCAVHPGFQPAVFQPPVDANDRPQWPARVVLRLGLPPLSLQGRVLDALRQPLPGARVWIADPLVVGEEDGDVLLAETLLADRSGTFWAFAVTDADGAFELRGLLARDYRVRAIAPGSLAATEVVLAAGRRDVEITLASPTHATVRGHVRARDGTPIADVFVKAQRPALEVQVPGGTRDEWLDTPPVRTDRDGAFALHGIARDEIELFAHGDAILFASAQLHADSDVGDVGITADRRVHVQVELAAPVDRADVVRIHDAADRPMLLRVMRGNTSFTNRSATLVEGRSQVLAVGEGAASVVLLRDGREVARLPVTLLPGPPTTIRW